MSTTTTTAIVPSASTLDLIEAEPPALPPVDDDDLLDEIRKYAIAVPRMETFVSQADELTLRAAYYLGLCLADQKQRLLAKRKQGGSSFTEWIRSDQCDLGRSSVYRYIDLADYLWVPSTDPEGGLRLRPDADGAVVIGIADAHRAVADLKRKLKADDERRKLSHSGTTSTAGNVVIDHDTGATSESVHRDAQEGGDGAEAQTTSDSTSEQDAPPAGGETPRSRDHASATAFAGAMGAEAEQNTRLTASDKLLMQREEAEARALKAERDVTDLTREVITQKRRAEAAEAVSQHAAVAGSKVVQAENRAKAESHEKMVARQRLNDANDTIKAMRRKLRASVPRNAVIALLRDELGNWDGALTEDVLNRVLEKIRNMEH